MFIGFEDTLAVTYAEIRVGVVNTFSRVKYKDVCGFIKQKKKIIKKVTKIV